MNQYAAQPAPMGQPQQFGVGQQFAAPATGTQFNSMFNNMGMPETPATGVAQAEPQDPNEWQLQCDAQHTDVEAIIRVLPRGLEGVKANMWPQVNCRKHYLKTRDGKRWGERYTVCRGNIPDPSSKYGRAYCPLCSNIWDRYYKLKNQFGDKVAKDSGITGNLPNDDIKVNALVIQDFVNPENNGQIKVWTAKKKQWEIVMAALPEKNVGKEGAVKQTYTSTPKYVGIPWHPIQGANLVLHGTWDSTKEFNGRHGCAVWEASKFEAMPTPLGPNDDAIIGILNQCHDLSKYDIQPPSVEELDKIQAAFFAAYDGAAAAAPDNNNNIAPNGFQSYQQPPQYGAPAAQGNTPQYMAASAPSAYVPPQPKTTVANAGTFFNNPQAPNYAAPAAPAPQPAAPAAPAQQSMFASAPMGMPNAGAPAPMSAPAAPAQPAPYTPPAAPAPAPAPTFAAAPQPAAPGGPTPIVQMGDDDDLPF